MGGHTPTPWLFTPSGSTMRDDYCQPFAVAETGKPNLICGCFGDVAGGREVAEANAAFIVEAVNSYEQSRQTIEALVVALTNLVADVEDYERVNNLAPNPGKKDCWQSMTRARSALLLAGEKKNG